MRFLTLFFVVLCYYTYVSLHRCISASLCHCTVVPLAPLCHCAVLPLRHCAFAPLYHSPFVNSQLQSVKYTTFIFSDSL